MVNKLLLFIIWAVFIVINADDSDDQAGLDANAEGTNNTNVGEGSNTNEENTFNATSVSSEESTNNGTNNTTIEANEISDSNNTLATETDGINVNGTDDKNATETGNSDATETIGEEPDITAEVTTTVSENNEVSGNNTGSDNSTDTNVGPGNSSDTDVVTENNTDTEVVSGSNTVTDVVSENNTVIDIVSGSNTDNISNSTDQTTTPDENESIETETESESADDYVNQNSTAIEDPLDLPQHLPPTCDSFIYCHGILLHTIQMNRVFDDSKYFVDLSMVNDPGATLEKFQAMMTRTNNQPSKGELEGFLAKNFVSEQELVPWIPEDYVEDPCFFADIKSEELRRFAGSTIKLWKTLGKKISEAVFDQPDRHSLIPIPNGFIASGGRYKEYYYWDNYWIIDSLIICGMLETAKGMIENFVTLILHYGYVPNGGRIYYSQRSQPPLLPFMVMRYYEETTDITWLEYFISFFETEMQYWVDNRMTTVTIGDKEMDVGVYRAESRGPRPEAYYEDVTYAEYFKTKEEQQRYYSDIKASAESGWDSSSRWIYDDQGGTEANLTFSRISKIVPVDLNAFLYGAFNIMSKFYLDLENYGKQSYWHKKATDMKVVIQELFWNEEDGMWYDYDIDKRSQRKKFYASNLTPLWTQALNETDCKKRRQIDKIIYYLKSKGLFDFPGGVPSSLQNTGKQWDMPNVWPPLQSMIVNGFYNADVSNGKYVARILAEKFLTATKKSFNSNGAMYQRYHAEHVGEPGPKENNREKRINTNKDIVNVIIYYTTCEIHERLHKKSTELVVNYIYTAAEDVHTTKIECWWRPPMLGLPPNVLHGRLLQTTLWNGYGVGMYIRKRGVDLFRELLAAVRQQYSV